MVQCSFKTAREPERPAREPTRSQFATYIPNAREIVSPDHVLPPLEPLDPIPSGLLFTHWLEERERHNLCVQLEHFKDTVSVWKKSHFGRASPANPLSIEMSIKPYCIAVAGILMSFAPISVTGIRFPDCPVTLFPLL